MEAGRKEHYWKKEKKHEHKSERRILILSTVIFIFFLAIITKLFFLQIVSHSFYAALASGQHDLFEELFPERGEIYVHDNKDNQMVAAVTNRQMSFVYADPRLIKEPLITVQALGQIFSWDEETEEKFLTKFSNSNDPFEPVKHQVDDDLLAKIMAAKLAGIESLRESVRFYPEVGLGGQIFGFVGSNEDGSLSGKYGIEGYFDDLLAGTPGFLRSEHDITGSLITVAEQAFQPAIDGADVVLTIDRNLQYFVCSKLKEKVEFFEADSGSVVIVEPFSGRLLAMCGVPDFDPNNYRQVTDINSFNNPITFDAYEPGSVFKAFTMAAALDTEAVEPTTTFVDTGSVMVEGWPTPLSNADNKVYGLVNMTQVLENSINTGVVSAMRSTGQDKFIDYVKRFGFGQKTGIEIQSESPGNISSLENKAEVYAATATFGQGITVTPLQLAMAYAAIANGGTLYQPMIVDEIRYTDGRVERRVPKQVTPVISKRTASLLGAMLVSVVENGHGKKAGVPGYYIAGKTGTAQVARTDGGGYETGVNIGTFAGFGPVSNPKFVMVVRINHPRKTEWAESSSAPVFGEIAEFLLKYYEIPLER